MVITDDELGALQGLPLGAQVLYLRELRPRMDYATGTVGRAHRVSWNGMRATLEVESRPGIAGEMPSREQVRRLAGQLERAGLIELISDMEGKQLIMRLPMAAYDDKAMHVGEAAVFEASEAGAHYSVRKKADRNPTVTRPSKDDRNPTGSKSSNGNGSSCFDSNEADRNPTVSHPSKADRHPVSVDRDEMMARAGECLDGGYVPTDGGAAQGHQPVGALFRQLLGQDGAATAAVMKAVGRVSAVARQRDVSEQEMRVAIADACGRGVGNVAAYAAKTIENGSLLQSEPKVVPFAQRGAGKAASGVSSVLAAAKGAMSHGS